MPKRLTLKHLHIASELWRERRRSATPALAITFATTASTAVSATAGLRAVFACFETSIEIVGEHVVSCACCCSANFLFNSFNAGHGAPALQPASLPMRSNSVKGAERGKYSVDHKTILQRSAEVWSKIDAISEVQGIE